MSSKHTEQLTCPACSRLQEFAVWDTVEASEDPQLKEQLLSGQLLRMTCAKCGTATDVSYRLLYHDRDYRLLLWLIPGDDMPSPDDPRHGAVDPDVAATHQLRVVRNGNALKEKIVIADAGLDDRVVELFKAVMRQDTDSRIGQDDGLWFAGLDTEDGETVLVFAVLRGEDLVELTVSFDVFSRYADAAESYAESLFAGPEPWKIVDETTAARKIREQGLS